MGLVDSVTSAVSNAFGGGFDDAQKYSHLVTQKKLDIEDRFRVDTLAQADRDANVIRAQAIRVGHKQVAQQAASGAVVGVGSTQAMVDETIKFGEMDAWITQSNARREADNSYERSQLIKLGGEAELSSLESQQDAAFFNTAIGLGGLIAGGL